MAAAAETASGVPLPLNNFVNPMLTDLYQARVRCDHVRHGPLPTPKFVTAAGSPQPCSTAQITMTYAYWKEGRHEIPSVFDLFFRKNPFGGEYTVFAGLNEVLKHVANFRFTPEHIEQLRCVAARHPTSAHNHTRCSVFCPCAWPSARGLWNQTRAASLAPSFTLFGVPALVTSMRHFLPAQPSPTPADPCCPRPSPSSSRTCPLWTARACASTRLRRAPSPSRACP